MIPGTLGKVLDKPSYDNLEALGNQHVIDQLDGFVKLCKPAKVMVLGESPTDISYIRELALKNGEEMPLKMEGHMIH
jgi:GTP-dependent phosphoenolpyruvate carboxykinase